MNILTAIIILAMIILGLAVLGSVVNLLWFLLIGLVIGALARLVIPGDTPLSILSTTGYGVAGALLGGVLADWAELGGLLSFLISIAVSALLIWLLSSATGRNERVDTF